MFRREIIIGLAALASSTFISGASAQTVEEAQAFIAQFASQQTTWTGPTTGPVAQTDKIVVMLAGDLTNGGIVGATEGAQEAAAAIGWDLRVIDGGGSVSGRTSAFSQAMALAPNGIIINGFDPVEQQVAVEAARAAGIAIVSWHATSSNGPDEALGIFANVTTNAKDVSQAAAYWAFIDAEQKPAVVIFTDSTYQIAIDKADWMKEAIEALGGTVLEYVDTPIAETSTRMPQLTTSLLQRYGDTWTHSLAINDLYFDFMGPSFAAAGLSNDDAPTSVAAGDGSQAAYQRVRAGEFQAVTVAEPLNLQGWQMIDELNRAFAGEAWSGFQSPLHVVTPENIEFDGGPENTFDPGNGYRDEYKKIWGVM